MPGCSTGRNIQKYKGAAASTLQDVTDNGNTTTGDIITTSGFFIGDGSLLTGIAGASSAFSFQDTSDRGNTTSNTIQFTNTITSLTTSGNVTVAGNVTASSFYGLGTGLTELNADNISSGTLSNDRLDTKTGTGNIVMSASPTLSGTITGGTFSGTHTGTGTGLSSLNASNISTGTLSNDRLGTVPYNKGGTGQTSYTRGDIIYSNANNSLAKLSIGTESGMFLRSDGTDVSWGTDGSRLTSINASNVSSGTLTTSRGGTGNTFSSASKSDLLVGTSGGTFATLSIPASSANGKVLKINGSNELFWGPDNTSTGGGGGGSGVLSLGSFMSYASGTDYNTSTGETIDLDATTSDEASHIVVRDGNKNINVTKVTLGTGTLTQNEYSGKSAKVNVTNNNDNSVRNIPFLNSTNDEIVKDQNSKLTWTPQASTITIGTTGSSGTSNTLTNTNWSGKSDKVTINTNNSTGARPVLFNEGDAVFKDGGTKFNWTPNPGTLSIGPIGGTHSTITASTITSGTFSGAHTGNGSGLTTLNASNISSGTLHSDRLSTKTGTGSVVMHTGPTLSGTITGGTFSGAHSGNGSGLTHLNFEASNNSGEVPVEHGGTGLATIGSNHILLGNGTSPMTTIGPEPNNTAKFLSSYNGGNLAWTSPSVSGISITNDTTSTSVQGITFAAGDGPQTIKSDQSTLHYKRSTGTLTTSNLITSGTSQFNGIANTAPTSTFSVGTVFSIQEWDGSGDPIDVMVVRKGNAFYEGNVYIGKTLTVPSGGKIEADTIKVRSHNVSGTTVINERKATIQRID